MAKFNIGDIVVHSSTGKTNGEPDTSKIFNLNINTNPAKMLILGVGTMNTKNTKSDLYLISYLTNEGHVCRNFVYEEELDFPD